MPAGFPGQVCTFLHLTLSASQPLSLGLVLSVTHLHPELWMEMGEAVVG